MISFNSFLYQVAISKDEKYVLAGFSQGKVEVYKKDTEYIKIQELTLSLHIVKALSISSNNGFIAAGTNKIIQVLWILKFLSINK